MIGQYELLEEIGHGTFGTVWKARHQTAGWFRAVKVANEPRLVEQFRVESEVLDQLNHPRIVRVYDLVTTGHSPAIILEYVEGTDLERLLRQSGGPLPWRQAVRVALEVLDGLAVAHAAGLLHRDIKPSNILLAADGHVKIADFGLVSAAERSGSVDWSQHSQSTHAAGSPYYMAPEVDEGAGAVEQSDVYSQGVVLYRCLTGRLPRGVIRPPSEVTEGCPPELDAVVMTLLAPEAQIRPPNASAASEALRTAAQAAVAAQRAAAARRAAAERRQQEEQERLRVEEEARRKAEEERHRREKAERQRQEKLAQFRARQEQARREAEERREREASEQKRRQESERQHWVAVARQRAREEEQRRQAKGRCTEGEPESTHCSSPSVDECLSESAKKNDETGEVHLPSPISAPEVTAFPWPKLLLPITVAVTAVGVAILATFGFYAVLLPSRMSLLGQWVSSLLVFTVVVGPPLFASVHAISDALARAKRLVSRQETDDDGRAETDLLAAGPSIEDLEESCRQVATLVQRLLRHGMRHSATHASPWPPRQGSQKRQSGIRNAIGIGVSIGVLALSISLPLFLEDRAVRYVSAPSQTVADTERQTSATSSPGTYPGDTVIGPDGAQYVWVPSGKLMMGSNEGEPDEQPIHEVYITQGFWLGRCEVTNAQFRAFCTATGHKFPVSSVAGDSHPVRYVSWEDAASYCRHFGLSLPTEAEWEYAARGARGSAYPWGDKWNRLNCCSRENKYPGGTTYPVGSFLSGASWCGALDLAGNASEWCTDWYVSDYYTAAQLLDPQGPKRGNGRVVRGGSCYNWDVSVCRSANRDNNPRGYYVENGFRCLIRPD